MSSIKEKAAEFSQHLLRLMLLFNPAERADLYAGKYTLSAYSGWRAWVTKHIHGRKFSIARVRVFLIDMLFFFDSNHCHKAAVKEGLLKIKTR